MKNYDRHNHQHDKYGQSWEIAASLWDGPKTLEEIIEHLHSYLRFLGFFNVDARLREKNKEGRMQESVAAMMDAMVERGWVTCENDHYALTSLGRAEASKPIEDMRRTATLLQTLVDPQTVSKVSLAAHLVLAAIKLPAGIISGSVGLINDATDTLLDGLSSLLVYAGLRFDRERDVNVVLVLLMLGTGGFTFYEAVRRFLVPFEPSVDWFTFAATMLSALICAGLWAYQRFVGTRSGCMSLITQSVDSRNHVIVAASVTGGLIAALLNFTLLDTLVGLAVAVLILKSAIELAIETIQTFNEDEVDLSRYKMGIVEKYQQFRQTQLRGWMLYTINQQGGCAQSDLIKRAQAALDFNDNPTLRELGLAHAQNADEVITTSVDALLEHGWVEGTEALALTPEGKAYLRSIMRDPKTESRHLLGERNYRKRHRRWHKVS